MSTTEQDGADSADPRRSSAGVLLTVRPRRITIYAAIASVIVVAVTVFVAVKLRSSDTGVIFRTSDAIAVVGLGLFFAAGLMLLARPRMRISADGIRVRNVVGERYVPWPIVQRLAFPEGSVWAQLEMADDEQMAVMALQAMDRSRAVESLRAARELITRYAPPPAKPTREYRIPDPVRPLGRLEQIDRIKAAQGKRKRPEPH